MATPIVPWVGGKRRLAKRILPIFPAHECYVEPFAGGAALFFLKEPSDVEVLNDINGELINLYRVVKHHLEEFVRQFKWALISRQLYGWLKKSGHDVELKLYEDGRHEMLNEINRKDVYNDILLFINAVEAMGELK